MRHIIFTKDPQKTYKVALLIKESALIKNNLEDEYINKLKLKGLDPKDIIAYSLTYNNKNKAPAKLIKESLQVILKVCKSQDIKTLFVTDGNYFKTLTKERKSEPHYGYVKQCKIDGYEDIQVILGVNYQALFYNPSIQERLDLSLETLTQHQIGFNLNLGQGIIHSAQYPKTYEDIVEFLDSLHQYPMIVCDIEGYGLSIKDCGVATIAFAWDKHNGGAFDVNAYKHPHTSLYFNNMITKTALLRRFFETYKGVIIYHGASFDIKQLIFNLYMDRDYTNYKGTIEGLKVFFPRVHDTKIITYLATNNAQQNNLGLKHNAFEFAGNYAQDDIKDISKIPLPEVLEYNLTDCLATWYVFEKYYPIMVQDKQLNVYNHLMLPALKVIVNMELVGLPLDQTNIDNAEVQLTKTIQDSVDYLLENKTIKKWQWRQTIRNFISGNKKLKTKENPIATYEVIFKPSSNKQVQNLLFDYIGLPVLDKTDGGAAAVGNKTLLKLMNQLKSEFEITDEELKQ